ncbi:Hypothetical predicted protein [Pelobates cultripes]|uniref:Uncharacterized protein n=1 Tax=Pelobates cultripes TaxID=61616 RepID=A0AAD1RC25_PELCU|nr:Hypothetical predicted protein [Pelobates cultripes]
MKIKEANDFQSKLRRMEYDRESTELRLTRELRDKEDSLALVQQKTKALQEEIAERERNDEQNKKRSQRLETELETMKKMLKQNQQEVITLQNDRELKIASYQNTIEQLQESIRQKMLIDDNWQAKDTSSSSLQNSTADYILYKTKYHNEVTKIPSLGAEWGIISSPYKDFPRKIPCKLEQQTQE